MRYYDMQDIELMKRSALAMSEYDYVSLGRCEYFLRVRNLHPQSVQVILHHMIARCRTANVQNGLPPCWDENYERIDPTPVLHIEPDLLTLDEAERAKLPPPPKPDPRWEGVREGARADCERILAWMPPAPGEARVADLLAAMVEAHGGAEGNWRSLVSQLKRVGFLASPDKGVYVLVPIAGDSPVEVAA